MNEDINKENIVNILFTPYSYTDYYNLMYNNKEFEKLLNIMNNNGFEVFRIKNCGIIPGLDKNIKKGCYEFVLSETINSGLNDGQIIFVGKTFDNIDLSFNMKSDNNITIVSNENIHEWNIKEGLLCYHDIIKCFYNSILNREIELIVKIYLSRMWSKQKQDDIEELQEKIFALETNNKKLVEELKHKKEYDQQDIQDKVYDIFNAIDSQLRDAIGKVLID